MTILASWSGDGLTAGTLTTSSAGTGDTAFSAINGTAPTIEEAGTRSPRIRVETTAGQSSSFQWGSAVLGSLTAYAVRFYVEISAHNAGSWSLIFAADAGTTRAWELRIAGTGAGTGTGQLRLNNASNVQIASSGTNVLPTGSLVRIEAVASAGTVTVTAYTGETDTVIATVTGSVGSTIDTIRVGPINTTAVAPFYVDDLAVSDTATEIGPLDPPALTWTLWDGATEIPLTLDGVWTGTSTVAATFDTVH